LLQASLLSHQTRWYSITAPFNGYIKGKAEIDEGFKLIWRQFLREEKKKLEVADLLKKLSIRDLPAPLPPITVTNSPSSMVRSTPRKAVFSLAEPLLYVLCISFNTNIYSNTDVMKIIGLVVSNGFVAFSGALVAQYRYMAT